MPLPHDSANGIAAGFGRDGGGCLPPCKRSVDPLVIAVAVVPLLLGIAVLLGLLG